MVSGLVGATHSAYGAELVAGAREVERDRRRLATGTAPVGDRYWVRVIGETTGGEPWGWRINGHHLAVHTVVGPAGATLTPTSSEPSRR